MWPFSYKTVSLTTKTVHHCNINLGRGISDSVSKQPKVHTAERLERLLHRKTFTELVLPSVMCFSGPDNILTRYLSQRTSRQEEIRGPSSVLIFQFIFHFPAPLSLFHQRSVVDCWISPPLAIILYELAELFTQLLAWDQWSTLGTEQNIEPERRDRHNLPQQSPPKQFW